MLNHRRGPDRIAKEAYRFLHLLDQHTPAFTFQTFREKGAAVEIPPKIVTGRNLGPLRIEHDRGAGIYVCVNETSGTGRKSENIRRIRCIWQEDDDGYQGGFPLPPSIVVETSPRHYHRYWLVADHWPADERGRADFAAIMERMVETYASDKNAKDISRVMRLPGFWNRKVHNGSAQRFEVRIVEASGHRYTRAQIMEAFPPVVREKQASSNTEWGERNDEDRRIRDALNHISDVDDREIWCRVGMALKQHMGAAGRSLWDQWSRRSDKYDEKDQEKNWRSFHRHDITIATLFHLAKQGGWKPGYHTTNTTNTNTSTNGDVRSTGGGWSKGTFTAHDLQSMTFPPISWILRNIIMAEGVTILCSKPKFGKSWLVYDLCIACAMNRITLGEYHPAQGDVLYLALEDSKRRLQRRMQKLLPGFEGAWSQNLTITTSWRRLHEGGLDDIRDWYKQTKEKEGGRPLMVAIDVLAKVRRPSGNRPAYEADYEALTGLHELSHELGIAIVVVHHTRKLAADDLMEMVSGTYGMTGAVDTVLVMASKATGSVLDIRGRDVEAAELALQFNKDSCKWTVLGNAAEVHVSDQRKAITHALTEAGMPMKITELVAATGMKRNPLELLLGKMVKDGAIKRVRPGLYSHKDYTPPPEPDPPKGKSVRSVRPLSDTRQMPDRPQSTEKTQESTGTCPSVRSVQEITSSAEDNIVTSPQPDLVILRTDQTDGQIAAQATGSNSVLDSDNLSGRRTDQTDRTDAETELPERGEGGDYQDIPNFLRRAQPDTAGKGQPGPALNASSSFPTCHVCRQPVPAGAEVTIRSTERGMLAAVHEGCLKTWLKPTQQ
jgi:hypothetical protein